MCVTLGPHLLCGWLSVTWWREHGEDDDAVAGRLIEGARLLACPDAAACGARRLTGGSGSSVACARAGDRVLLGHLRGLCARVGGQAGSVRLARKVEQAWAAAAPSSFLSLLFVANLVRV